MENTANVTSRLAEGPNGELLPSTSQILVDFANRLSGRHDAALALLERSERHVKSFRRHLVGERGEARPGFNLFRVLGIDRREMKTHSALLRELLDPLGAHGQGNLFLRFVLGCLWTKAGLGGAPSDSSDADWTVETEVAFEGGRMDLVMRNIPLGINIVIENKIDFHDMDGQLVRYSRWQGRLPASERKTALLVYLTRDGSKPSDRSFKAATPDEMADISARLVLLSYHDDLAAMLTTALGQVAARDVHFLVNHYAQLIKVI